MSATGASDLIGQTPGGRKLIAVVHADMVGYSRLIGLDDSGTLERLRRLRSNLIDPATEEHGGRIVNTGGDSLLIDSVDGAVRWAVKVQQDVPACDGDQPPDRAIRFRVGIDAGDVIPEGTDVHGDVVNVAARLQAACPPSGICVSRAVREHVRGRLDLRFEELGHLALKNIVRPVEAFVLRLDPNERFPVPAVRRRPTMRPMVLGSLAALLLALGLGAAWWLHRDGFPPIAESPRASAQFVPPAVGLSSAPRLSLVVLPFDKFGGEGVEDYIVDGITEDLTTDLSRLPGFLVIARNSAFTYKGKPIDVKRVGEELGVRYAVEGSVRNAGGSLRVNAQLVSTETGAHIWADRFDVGRDVGDRVDDIVRHIARQLNGQIVDTESARGVRERPANPDATDVLLRARALNALPRNPQRQAQIVALFERAVELDPMSATAVAELGNAILDSTLQGVADDPTVPEKLHRAEALITRAELMRPDAMQVMLARVVLLLEQDRCQEVIPAAQRTIEAYPNVPGPHFSLGICLLRNGRSADAIPKIEQAIRLDPRHPSIFNRYQAMGYALEFLARYDEAISWFHRSLAANPNASAQYRGNTRAAIAAAQALAGRTEEARLSAVEASGLWPTITVRSYFRIFNVTNPVLVEQVSRMREGLRLAGVRDHADEDADLGVPPDDVLHINYVAPTPITVPGARTIHTLDLAALVEQRKPLVLDTNPWGRSIPDAVGLRGAGVGGSVSDEFQDRLRQKMQQLTRGDRSVPVVTMGWNAERFQGRNLALRLVALGYTEVYWYRGGSEAWTVAGLPEAELVLQEW